MTPRMSTVALSAMAELFRVRELQITRTGGSPLSRLPLDFSVLTTAAPILYSLSIVVPDLLQHPLSEGLEASVLPETLFDGVAPRLRRVELVKCHLRWNSPLLVNLTHLKIHSSTTTDNRPTISELLMVLENMPELETLDLEDSLPSMPVGSTTLSSPTRVVEFPRMSRLQLADATLECANLLNYISLPSTTAIKIRCKRNTNSDFSALFSALPQGHFSAASSKGNPGKPLKTLSIECTFKSVSVKGWTGIVSSEFKAYHPLDVPHLDLEFELQAYSAVSSKRVMTSACRALQLVDLRMLYVYQVDTAMQTSDWVDMFGTMPKLRNICLNGSSHSFVNALREGAVVNYKKRAPPSPKAEGRQLRSMTSRPNGGLFFPALRYLTLVNTDFEEVGVNDFENLMDCLMERCERKMELWKLTLEECIHLSWDDVEQLRDIVVDVDWDEFESTQSDDEDIHPDFLSNSLYDDYW